MEFNHYSVLLEETIENLNIKPDGIYVDGTLGGGGHAYHVCERLNSFPNREDLLELTKMQMQFVQQRNDWHRFKTK